MPPEYDRIYAEAGLPALRQILQLRQPDYPFLGDRLAGYFLGRYAIHSLMWYHSAWERSPEYQPASLSDKHEYLTEARDIIESMTTGDYFRDVSLIGDESFKGSDGVGYDRWADGWKGWGFKRWYDAFVPVPKLPGSSDYHVTSDKWYKSDECSAGWDRYAPV